MLFGAPSGEFDKMLDSPQTLPLHLQTLILLCLFLLSLRSLCLLKISDTPFSLANEPTRQVSHDHNYDNEVRRYPQPRSRCLRRAPGRRHSYQCPYGPPRLWTHTSRELRVAVRPERRQLFVTPACELSVRHADFVCQHLGQAACQGIARPNASQAIDTNKCAAKCDQGDGSAGAAKQFSDCVQGCIASLFPSSQTAFAPGNIAAASASSVSAGASATGSTSLSPTASIGEYINRTHVMRK